MVKGCDQPDILQDRWAQALANPADLAGDSFDLGPQARGVHLVCTHEELSEVGQRLVVEVTCDPAPFAFGFVRRVESRSGELQVPSAKPPVFDERKDQPRDRTKEQPGETGRGPRKRRLP